MMSAVSTRFSIGARWSIPLFPRGFSSAETMPTLKEARSAPPKSAIAATCVNASLHLDFEFDRTFGCTFLRENVQEAPLKVVRAFPVGNGSALVHLHNVSGGLLGGDRLATSVKVGERASAQLTTTGATRIYRARIAAAPAMVTTNITVGQDGCLEYLPDPIIPYAGSCFSQRTTIHLGSGAGLFWWEVLAPGREAGGELFEYELAEMRTDIYALGRTVAIERVRVEPARCAPTSPARLGHYRYWSTFYICRVGLKPGPWLALEEQLRQVAQGFSPASDARWGISILVAHGIVCRCVSVRGRDALTGLHALWRAAKLALYGSEAIPPRKVN
jgi:urease accessory protein